MLRNKERIIAGFITATIVGIVFIIMMNERRLVTFLSLPKR